MLHGPDIAVGELLAERSDPNYRDVVLERRLREALARLNPELPPEALGDAYRKLTRVDAPSLVERNRAVHRMLVDGVTVEYRRKDGSIAGAQARVIDFDVPANNDWLAVNQFTVSEGQHTRRPDVVLFVNGLPLAVIELKNPADENATVWSAFQQLQTYQAQIPALFATNAALLVSDGVQARIGALGAGKEWFKPWRTITGRELASTKLSELQVVLEGVFERSRFLDLIRYFIVFEDEGGGKLIKKMAGYHQFHAVNAAVEETLRAAENLELKLAAEQRGEYRADTGRGGDLGDRRVGVVWHTQGSGKSLTMAFYAGPRDSAPGDGQPDDRGADRPQRSRRPALRHLRALPRLAAPAAGAGRRPRRSARETRRRLGRRGVHHDPEVFPRRERATGIRCCRSGATSSSSPTRRTAASTTSSTASRGTCATHCRMHHLSVSPARRSNRPMRTHARCSATTSASMTSSAPCTTARRCRSTTRAAWRSWS